VGATIFQRVVPDAVRGRALGVIATLAMLAYAAGSFAIPALTGPLGVLPILGASGLAVVTAAVVAVIAVLPHRWAEVPWPQLATCGGLMITPPTGR